MKLNISYPYRVHMQTRVEIERLIKREESEPCLQQDKEVVNKGVISLRDLKPLHTDLWWW